MTMMLKVSSEQIQQERGLAVGDRAMRGASGMDINSPERVSNYL